MRHELVEFLACPTCGTDLALEVQDEVDDEVISGTLACGECGRTYPVVRGVPRLNERTEGMEQVARAFSFEWKAHHEGKIESETVFGRTSSQEWEYFEEATGLDDERLDGKVVLDAGCGPAQVTRLMAEHGARVAIGMDFNEAVDEAFTSSRSLKNVHIVQGNVFAPPFKTRTFDLVWSNGVIHHTPDAEGAHRSLSRFVKPGGILFVWVYADRFNPFRFTKDVLDALRVTRLPEPVLFGIARLFAYASLILLRLYQVIRSIPGLRARSRRQLRTVRDRTFEELELTWLDALAPKFNSRHTEPEVIGWFENLGFTDVRPLEEPKVGVRGIAPVDRER
jgi:SAM-dependent methyltransferase/uncharacterized protein YbaR (Trm112 family)